MMIHDHFIFDKKKEKKLIYKIGFIATFKNFEEWIKQVKLEKNLAWGNKGERFMVEAPNAELCKNKAGIYMFTNNITKKMYIGKSSDLLERLINYSYVPTLWGKPSSNFNKALIKFGLNNFSITLIEYCSIKELDEREAYYILFLKPQYNMRKPKNSFVSF